MGHAIQAIVGGTASGGARDAVLVLVRYEAAAPVSLCTATLIAPNLVVTARHCVSAVDPVTGCAPDGVPVAGAMLHGDRAPADLGVFVGIGGKRPDFDDPARAVAHGKKLVVDDATTICNHDVAFVVLDTRPSAPVAPIRLAPPGAAELLTAVGWGVDEGGMVPKSRLERSGLSILGAGPMADPNDGRYGIGNAELFVSESACAGDSGSPLLAPSGAILGVASRAGNGQPRDPNNMASTCVGPTAHAVYSELAAPATTALTLRAFAEAGAKPWLEGEPDPYAIYPDTTTASATGAHAGTPSSPAPPLPNATIEATVIPPESTGGCNASGEPTRGAVEQAMGAIALLAAAFGVRRRQRREP